MTIIPETKSCPFPTNLVSSKASNALTLGNLFDLIQKVRDFEDRNCGINPANQQIRIFSKRGDHIFALENHGLLITYSFFPHDDDVRDDVGLSFDSRDAFTAFFSLRNWQSEAARASREIK